VHPYSLNGAPIDVSAGDWFVGKAAASIIMSHPVLNQVQIFNTHLFAKGGDDGPEHLRAHRLVNAWEFSKLAREAAELGRYVIAAGDFNSIPTTLPMTIIRDHAALTDAWSVTHPNRTSSSSNLSPPLEAITVYGITADSPLNSYSAGKALDAHARQCCGKRLDYILYRQPNRPDQELPILACTESKVVLTGHVPGYDFSFSDHFGLEATLEFSTLDNADQNLGKSPYARNSYSSSSSISSIKSQDTPSLSSGSITTAIQALTACYRYSRHRARRELTIFGFCLLLLVALTVGSLWLSHPWINPLFLIFTIFITWLGTTMLYEGFLYGNWEVNALMNVIEELEILRKGRESPRRLRDAT
jgi:sphingomyelin phosphodiesterase 2